MSAPETEATSADGTPAATAVETPGIRRAVIISCAVFAALGVLIGLVLGLGPPAGDADAGESDAAISAAEWLGVRVDGGADAGNPDRENVADQTPNNDSAQTSDRVEGPAAEGESVRRGEVRSGVPVIKSLTSLGLSAGDAQRLINALDGLFDFRRARPGQTFEVRLDTKTCEPVYFRYDASLVDVYEVRKRGDEYAGRKKNIPTQKRTRRFGGTIASSLYSALDDAGAHPSLAGAIVDVLSTQVDFYKEQRPGDTFRVLVEEERLGDEFLGYGPVLALEYDGVKAGRKRFFRFRAGKKDPTYYDEKGISVPRSAIAIPLHYTRISSPFGLRYHPVLKRKKLHNGVDFAAGHGTPVWACAEGEITVAAPRGANGNLVGIDHGDGLRSYYAHLSRFARGIRRGVEVRRKQVIGYVGSTGRSTGPHLHFGLKKNGKFLDPLEYKIRPGRPVARRYRAKLEKLIEKRGAELDRTRIRPPSEPLDSSPPDDEEVLGLEENL
ncbi:MAG: M23 family metallopeptidase [Polyangia bacterium]